MTLKQSPIRVVVPIDSHDPSSWAYALAYAKKICDESAGTLTKIVLLTHTKNQLSSTSLRGHLGDARAITLLNGGTLTVSPGVGLTHGTMRTLSSVLRGTVAIVFYGGNDILDLVDGVTGLGGVVVVPEFDGDVADWTARWNPHVHGAPPSAPAVLISNKTVTNALEQLSSMVNLSHGVMHPRDKGYADDILRILRANGHAMDPAALKSWAIQRGWQVKAADELAALATKIWALKAKPRLSGIYNAQVRYEGWKGR